MDAARSSGTNRFQGSITETRMAVITAGEHEFSLGYVEDATTVDDESALFYPTEKLVDFNRKKRYQLYIAAKNVEFRQLSPTTTLTNISRTLKRRPRKVSYMHGGREYRTPASARRYGDLRVDGSTGHHRECRPRHVLARCQRRGRRVKPRLLSGDGSPGLDLEGAQTGRPHRRGG
jgi:hypothetical protein